MTPACTSASMRGASPCAMRSTTGLPVSKVAMGVVSFYETDETAVFTKSNTSSHRARVRAASASTCSR